MKTAGWALLLLPFAAMAAPAAAADQLPPVQGDAEACAGNGQGVSAHLRLTGFKDRTGNIRVQLYPGNEDDFLAPRKQLIAEGKTFKRIQFATPAQGDADVCVALPGPGRYAIAVLHDRNANGKLNVFSDGFGFTRNPKLGLGRPSVTGVAFEAAGPRLKFDIVLNYWSGGSARPVAAR